MLSGPVPYPIVECVWIDIVGDCDWVADPEHQTDLCLTMGFLVKETDDTYIIASTISNDHNGVPHSIARMQIPKGIVKSLRML